jgi:hypothetical protein
MRPSKRPLSQGMRKMGQLAEAHMLGRRQGQDRRKHAPGYELKQQHAPDHLRTAPRPAMNMMTAIPTVMEIEIAKTKPPASISVIFFSSNLPVAAQVFCPV